MAAQLYDIPVKKIDGTPASLKDYQGDVLLVVNVASKCGLTPQYEGLEKLYKQYQGKGFRVLGFPANEFAGQEPGTNAEIQTFCTSNYGVDFPMFEKVVVKGQGQHPLFQQMIEQKPKAQMKAESQLRETLNKHGLGPTNDRDVMWNFEKFLIGRDGKVAGRFAPDFAPDDADLTGAIEAELAKKA